MKITSAVFLKSAFEAAHWPPENLPEIAFLGRSNVGKSSLLNSLLNVKGLARTSSTPGRTQALNFFVINEKFRFVDLPGYGYARVPKAMRAQWGQMAEEYLANRTNLVLSIHIVDARHEPTELDAQLNGWLRHFAQVHLIVATKSDKLSQNELRKNLERIRRSLTTEQIIAFSAVTNRGRADIWHAITAALAAHE